MEATVSVRNVKDIKFYLRKHAFREGDCINYFSDINIEDVYDWPKVFC